MKIRVKTEGSRFWDDTRPCPKCLVEGKGQHPLRRTEVWDNAQEQGIGLTKPFHEIHYSCANCGGIFYDVE